MQPKIKYCPQCNCYHTQYDNCGLLNENGLTWWENITTFKHETTPELDKTLFLTAGILAAGAIVTALIIKYDQK
jgi:hypothetical protein